MEKEELAKRLSYIKEKSYGLTDGHDTFRSSRLLREALMELCDLLQEVNDEIEDSKKPEWPDPKGPRITLLNQNQNRGSGTIP